jgi:hypothetical protein
MRIYGWSVLGVSVILFVVFLGALLLGTFSEFSLFNQWWFFHGMALAIFLTSICAVIGGVLCLGRRDWRTAVIMFVTLCIVLMIPLVYYCLLFGSFA